MSGFDPLLHQPVELVAHARRVAGAAPPALSITATFAPAPAAQQGASGVARLHRAVLLGASALVALAMGGASWVFEANPRAAQTAPDRPADPSPQTPPAPAPRGSADATVPAALQGLPAPLAASAAGAAASPARGSATRIIATTATGTALEMAVPPAVPAPRPAQRRALLPPPTSGLPGERGAATGLLVFGGDAPDPARRPPD